METHEYVGTRQVPPRPESRKKAEYKQSRMSLFTSLLPENGEGARTIELGVRRTETRLSIFMGKGRVSD